MVNKGIVVLVFLGLCLLVLNKPIPPTSKPVNNQIVIGILDQPVIKESSCNLTKYGAKYLPASYVKLVESVGARVVPIPYDGSDSLLHHLFNSVNGIILPGGDADFTPGTTFYRSAQYLFNLTIDANDRGDYFPLIGICQGMEMLTVMMAQSDMSVLNYDYDAQNLSLPLNFTSDAHQSVLWGSMPGPVNVSLSQDNVTFNAHDNGLPPENYYNTSVRNWVTILSTNYDRNGKEFVSSYEGTIYPLWGLQFHPSRLAYEWRSDEAMNHTVQAINDMQYIAYTMYDQARYNTHKFESQDELYSQLIYNYQPVYTYPVCPTFEQCYFWDNVE